MLSCGNIRTWKKIFKTTEKLNQSTNRQSSLNHLKLKYASSKQVVSANKFVN